MNTRVLIFDSGVGGLSVLKEIQQRLPGHDLHYLMDNAAFPYGTKTDDFLIPRILRVCTQAINQLHPDLLVVACNTASTLALEQLRQQLPIPVVGVVPAIKVAAAQAEAVHIGLLATPATVRRPYTDQLIQEFGQGKSIQKFGSSALVEWAEQWITHGQPPDLNQLQRHLEGWINQNPPLTHIVLGCTHFPLLGPHLQQLWPQIQWIDSGAAIARRVASLLPNVAATTELGTLALHWTDVESAPDGVAQFMAQLGVVKIQQCIPIEMPVLA